MISQIYIIYTNMRIASKKKIEIISVKQVHYKTIYNYSIL